MNEKILTIYDILQNEKDSCADFVKNGGDKALFWAGRMSRAAMSVYNSHPLSLSDAIEWLWMVTQEYDKVVIDRTNKKD